MLSNEVREEMLNYKHSTCFFYLVSMNFEAKSLSIIFMESLILAQDERWRRA